jgi:general secretion pathway protein D
VMLEVEVLEIGSNKMQQLGIRYPDTLAFSLSGAAGIPGRLSLTEWQNRGSELVQLQFNDPLFLLSLHQDDGSTTVLANPRIRVKNKEKARVHIGDRVPVITTTAAATGGFVSESVSYLDVGLKLEVEPLIYLEDEIGIKVGLEVSNIVKEIRTVGSNTLSYQIGTRNAATALRLKDGETQVLAGLISNEDRQSAVRVPGLGELPVIGRLFSNTTDNRTKTEIVLLITPRLLRQIARPDAASVEFAAGTESSSGTATRPSIVAPFTPQAQPPQVEGSQQGEAPVPPPAAPQQPGSTMVPFGGIKPAPQ